MKLRAAVIMARLGYRLYIPWIPSDKQVACPLDGREIYIYIYTYITNYLDLMFLLNTIYEYWISMIYIYIYTQIAFDVFVEPTHVFLTDNG